MLQMNRRLRRFGACCALLAATAAPVWAAAPSVDQVEQALRQGDYARAETMLGQVVAEHPSSARAHYLYAQVLDRDGRLAQARDEIGKARELDPALRFTDPARFRQVEAKILADAGAARSDKASRAPSPAAPSGSAQNPFSKEGGGALATANTEVRAPARRGSGAGLWLGLAVILALVAAVAAWSVKRGRRRDEAGGEAVRLSSLKRATELLDAVRGCQLDLKLSQAPQREAWLSDARQVETELSQIIESLSGDLRPTGGAQPPELSAQYRLAELGTQVERLQALAAGRPDPSVQAAPAAPSAYAEEASRFGRSGGAPGAPYSAPGTVAPPPGTQWPQQGPIQNGGGSGVGGMIAGGVGGLVTGMVLGEMMSRHAQAGEVPHHGGGASQEGFNDGGVQMPPADAPFGGGFDAANNGFDFGNGGADWGDGGGSFDVGSNDSGSNDWDT